MHFLAKIHSLMANAGPHILNIIFGEQRPNLPTKAQIAPYLISDSSSVYKKLFPIRALYIYEDSVKTFIQELKYRHNTAALNLCAEIFNTTITDFSKKICDQVYIIPIPSCSLSISKRGYKHIHQVAEILCAKNNTFLLLDILINTSRITQKQSRTRQERMVNIERNLKIKTDTHLSFTSHEINNSIFVIIDDVTTTGATLRTAQNLLFKIGARNVICLSIAHKVLT